MKFKHTPVLTPYARDLRKRMTKEERKLWYNYFALKPIRVLRQKVVDNYILDFYCASSRIGIELDGSQHYSEEGELKDSIRTAIIEEYGISIYRIPNNAVNQNFEGVCAYLDEVIGCYDWK